MLDELTYPDLVVRDDMLMSFITDMAQGIQEVSTVCDRYGFANRAVLHHFIRNNPAVDRLIKQRKAAYDSDDNVERRVRLKAGLFVEEAMGHIAHLIVQQETPVGQKIDCFHKLLRAAGTDGPPPAPLRADQGGGGPTFTLNFIWSDGTRENVLSARPSPVIEHDEDTR